MKAKNKIFAISFLLMMAIASIVFAAAGSVLPPVSNTTAMPIAGANSSTLDAIVITADPTTGALLTSSIPSPSSGATMLFDVSCDNSAQSAKASAGYLVGGDFVNPNGTNIFIQLFDSATAPTIGTTTPNYVIFIPAMGAYVKDSAIPLTFTNKIYYACTTTQTGSGAPALALTASFVIK